MPKVITNGKISIGTYTFPDRKKPCICVEKGNEISVYGSFHNAKEAEMFMNELADLVGAKKE